MASHDEEKASIGAAAHVERNEKDIEQHNGEVHLFSDGASSGLKLASDGKTVLIPQPSDDPLDPLNFSWGKKHAILILLSLCAFGGDFQSGAGIPLLASQGAEWNLSPVKVNEAGNLNVLLLGIGGLVWPPLCYAVGRLPVLFWTQLLGTFMVLGSVLSESFSAYYAFRPLTSLFLTAGQVIGLLFVRDMFFFHERVRKLAIWVLIFLISPYCGPFFGGFMVDGLGGQWRPVLWLVFSFSCLMLLAVILVGDETWYPRDVPADKIPPRTPGVVGRIKDLTGVRAFELRHLKPSLTHSIMRQLEVFTKPVVWVVFIVYALSFMWAVGINITSSILFATPQEAGGYGLSLRTISFIYFTPLVGLCLGEAFGHWANDWVANSYIKKHNGVFKPECRLYTFFVASFLMIPGLILVGFALHLQLTVAAVVIGWGAYVVGVMIASVSITAYILDSFPSASCEVSAMVNLSRTISGFSVGYFQMSWGASAGFHQSFGIQAAIVGIATIMVAGLLFFGERIRKLGGRLHYSDAAL